MMGVLTVLEPYSTSSTIAQRDRGETVRVTLWGETATTFDDIKIQTLLPPVFIALTSLKVKLHQGNPVLGSTGVTVYVFNPDIPQLSEYKHKFEHLRSPVRMLPTSADMYVGRPTVGGAESKTIDDLLLLNPALHRNESSTCEAAIVGVDLARGWWYKSCPSCHKIVKKMFESFECNEHGLINKLPEPWFKIDLILEDSTNQHNFLMIGRYAKKMLRVSCHTLVIKDRYDDPFILPPILKTLVGETKQFQLSFGNQNTDFGKIDFIVNGLLQDQDLSNPMIASIKPQTPTTTAGKQVVSQTTSSPLTPSQLLQQRPQPIEPIFSITITFLSNLINFPFIHSNKHRNEQTDTTNFATIAGQFHNLVVPKIEPTDKVLIAMLKTKSQAKKSKER
ncbi:replication protein A 70 kDa DNA-binding subunit B-like [Pyrus ussuriensis x Pyrus communis]|uniref:Replication protein A 70 kDa DNA-binding subunit B-like n=1 Tax=Pyrus ussuriensis x Pyrus communis TaxID=2448454 RepID=A0A5N5G122_9ROSA|nr:replication protein A 70 kDa DNA-binding subunit B-like [Pyrus ussuriensis x Pyrus communis]